MPEPTYMYTLTTGYPMMGFSNEEIKTMPNTMVYRYIHCRPSTFACHTQEMKIRTQHSCRLLDCGNFKAWNGTLALIWKTTLLHAQTTTTGVYLSSNTPLLHTNYYQNYTKLSTSAELSHTHSQVTCSLKPPSYP